MPRRVSSIGGPAIAATMLASSLAFIDGSVTNVALPAIGRELGGDDFAEYFDPKDGLFTRLQHSADDLVLSATATHLSLAVVPPA